MHSSVDRSALCPRCGYDQRGLTATWRESCPLDATCTECGFRFACSEMLCPEKYEPRWCIEYCEARPLRFAKSFAGTVTRSMLPWRFWSQLQMAHRVNAGRITIYVVSFLLPLVLLYIGVQAAAALYVRSQVKRFVEFENVEAAQYAAQLPPETNAETEAFLAQRYGSDWPQRLGATTDEDRARVIANWKNQLAMQHAWGKDAVANPIRIDGSAFWAILEAVFLPTSTSTRINLSGATWQTINYPASSELWPAIVSNVSRARPAVTGLQMQEWFDMSLNVISCLGFSCLMAALFPLSLALVPATRKRSKVRWAHIGRVTAYGVAVPFAALYGVIFLLAADLIMTLWFGPAPWVEFPLLVMGVAFIPLGLTLWWLFAISRHLKMPHALAITAILMFVSFLTALAITYHATERFF